MTISVCGQSMFMENINLYAFLVFVQCEIEVKDSLNPPIEFHSF